MISRISLISLLFFALSPYALAASKSDLAKEKRWEEQIVPSLLVGEAVKLKADVTEFLGIYAENTADKALGGIIVMHGIGVHPAWPDVIDPLRMQLSEVGWHTLSLQMPILPNEATGKDYPPLYDEVPARIQAGVDFLKSKGVQNIVLAGHSMGAGMGLYYLSTKPDPAVRAFVCISSDFGFPADARMDNIAHFRLIKIPFFDVSGSIDNDDVLKASAIRSSLAKKLSNKNYQQKVIEGANHFYNNMQDELVKIVRGWIEKNAKGTEIKK